MRLMLGATFLGGMLAVVSFAEAQPPGGRGGQPPGKGGFGKGGFGGGGFAAPQPGQILPTPLQEALKLSDDQKKQVEALQKDVDEKIGKILTEDQQKQLKEMRERGPGRGPGGFGPGGPGGKGGDRGRDRGKGDKKDPPLVPVE